MVDRLIFQQATNCGVGFARLDQRRIGHHSFCVEGTKREDSTSKRGRNLVLVNRRLGRIFADENGVTGTVRIVGSMRNMIDQQKRFADVRIVERDPTGEIWLGIGRHASCSLTLQLLFAKADEM